MNISEWIREVKQLIESPADTIAGFIVGVIFGSLVTWRIAKAILARKLKNEIERLKEKISGLKRDLCEKDSDLGSYIQKNCDLRIEIKNLMGKWESTDIALGEALAKVEQLETQLTDNQRKEPSEGSEPRRLPTAETEQPAEPTLKLVTTPEEIVDNLRTIEAYLSSSSEEDVAFAKLLLARGKCFVILQLGERIIAGPSRFIGYAKNSRQKHLLPAHREILSGGDANWAITNVLGDYEQSKELDELFKRFCEQCGAKVSNIENRKFWIMQHVKLTDKGMCDPDGIIPPGKSLFEEPDLTPQVGR